MPRANVGDLLNTKLLPGVPVIKLWLPQDRPVPSGCETMAAEMGISCACIVAFAPAFLLGTEHAHARDTLPHNLYAPRLVVSSAPHSSPTQNLLIGMSKKCQEMIEVFGVTFQIARDQRHETSAIKTPTGINPIFSITTVASDAPLG
jgi:hypothetical protein